MFTPNELKRYSRQILLFGEKNQEKIKNTKVGIVGVGGLGSIVSLYLTALGVGKIKLIDGDTVSLSNLNRQILYTTQDLGKKKAILAMKRLSALNPNVKIEAFVEKLTPKNIRHVLNDVDFIFDCLDNWETRYLVDSYAWHNNKILIHGGAGGFGGQVLLVIPKKTPCLRCLSRKETPKEKIPVVGAIVGTIGLLQVLEFLKLVIGEGQSNAGKLIVFDGYTPEINTIEIKFDESCKQICEEILYEQANSIND